jgi:hypothetical protein
MTKIISLIFLFVFLLSGITHAFPDARGHWAERTIREVSTQRPDVIGGFPDGTVRPSETVTREQFMKMLMTSIKAGGFASSRANFTDVGATRWSKKDIHTAVHFDILRPDEEGARFRPATPITREDMALYATRLLGIGLRAAQGEVPPLTFTDRESISERHRNAVAVAVQHGLLSGYPDGTFGPQRSLTRAEAFVVISRILREFAARENIITGTEGKAFGNIDNFSIAKQYNGWIYHTNVAKNMVGIYRIRNDGTQKTKLSNDDAWNLFILDDWIYYGNWNVGGRLYRVRTDGTSRIRLSDQVVTHINVAEDQIFFINRSSNHRIYRIGTNGGGLTRITEDRADSLVLSSGWLYYPNLSSNSRLYKIRTDGNERTRVVDTHVRSINVIEPWIVFSGFRGDIWRVKPDGTGLTRIIGQLGIRVNVSNGRIFYTVSGDNHQVYSINLNGTDLRRVVSGTDGGSIAGSWMYFLTISPERGTPPQWTYRVRLDGTQRERVVYPGS